MTRHHNSPAALQLPVSVRVPASASNLGAGFDCVGLALDLWMEARLVAGPGPPHYSGTLATLPTEQDIILRALGGRAPPGCRLEVSSEIPMSRGLGSSGAAVVAGHVLAGLIHNTPVDRQSTYEAARDIEGHPDNAGPATFGGLVLATEQPHRVGLDARVGVACAVPDAVIDTQTARAMLPTQIARDKAVAQAARAAALLLGLTRGDADLLRYGMQDLIAVPRRKALIVGFEDAVAAGLANGAFGVTISGSGTTLLAFCPPTSAAPVAQAMSRALCDAGNPAVPLTPRVSDCGYRIARGTSGRG